MEFLEESAQQLNAHFDEYIMGCQPFLGKESRGCWQCSGDCASFVNNGDLDHEKSRLKSPDIISSSNMYIKHYQTIRNNNLMISLVTHVF